GPLDAVDLSGRAPEHVALTRIHLPRPSHPAGAEIERDHGIGGRLRRPAVSIAGAHVDGTALRVDRRCRPDAAAGRAPHLGAVGVGSNQSRRAGDGVGLPDNLAGAGVERDERAAERAAGVTWWSPPFFVR